jgi:AI-2 transport protein TqsA
VILLALIFWGMLWGLIGVLFAVPMTAALRVVFSRLGFTQPIANLLAGRPTGLANRVGDQRRRE